MLSNTKVMVYEDGPFFAEKASEKFRFKLVDSPVLMKPTIAGALKSGESLIVVEPKMVVILHPIRPFTITVRKERTLFHSLGYSQAPPLSSMTPFKAGFLIIDSNGENLKIAKMPIGFDVRKMHKVTDGYLLHQVVLRDKGIKGMKIFSPQIPQDSKDYLFLSTFTFKKPSGSQEYKSSVELGFTSNTKAPSYQYQLEVFVMPKPGAWKEYSVNFHPNKAIIERFQENQVITCLE